MPRLICIRYTDEMSVGGCSLTDMELGASHCLLGSNSKRLGTFVCGDIAIILANDKSDMKYFTIAQITESARLSCMAA
jgi:hypothetical protein